MSEFRIGTGPFFDKGLDGITSTNARGTQNLPADGFLLPPEQGNEPRLQQLFPLPDLGTWLDHLNRPAVPDGELLRPARFTATLASAHESISQAARRQGDSTTPDARSLRRADLLLRDQRELRELALSNWNALIAG